MTDKPRIGVTLSARGSFWTWLMHRLSIVRAGGVPVRITADDRRPARELDAVVVGGGDDISFHLDDGELSPTIRYDPERDQLERDILEDAFETSLPVLGICRGAQMLNLVRGGTLYFDLSEISDKAPRGRMLLPRKTVRLSPASRLAGIMRCNPCRVNALHHQAVREPGDGLEIAATDDLDIVQAIEAPGDRFTLGVQWHPELLPFSRPQVRIFKALVSAAMQTRKVVRNGKMIGATT